MNNPQVIGIAFHDNDFYFAITAFLGTMKNIGLQNYKDLTKEKFVEIYNRSIGGFYWLAQNKMEYRTDWDASRYLQITVKDVYFDDEVKDYIEKHDGWDNGEFFVLDTQVHNNYIYSV
jgi:hypothetical protein